jgi:hypothetical protein
LANNAPTRSMPSPIVTTELSEMQRRRQPMRRMTPVMPSRPAPGIPMTRPMNVPSPLRLPATAAGTYQSSAIPLYQGVPPDDWWLRGLGLGG